MSSLQDRPIEDPGAPLVEPQKYSVQHQDVDLDVDFATQTIHGHTAILVEPLVKDLKEIKLRCRQMEIKSVKIDKWPISNYKYTDPYQYLTARNGYTVHQHHWIQQKVDNELMNSTVDLTIPVPRQLIRNQEGQRLTLRFGQQPAAKVESDPFQGKPPALVRTVLYQYWFTDLATKRKTGAWWRRTELGPFTGVVGKP